MGVALVASALQRAGFWGNREPKPSTEQPPLSPTSPGDTRELARLEPLTWSG